MPKRTFKIQGYHGGTNSNSDPRDISDVESPSIVDVNIDKVGKITTIGGVGTPVGGTHDLSILNNRGLFVVPSDRKLDGTLSSETFILNYDSTDNVVDIKDSDGWDASVINTNSITPHYYNVDGNIRVADAALSREGRWLGYIDTDKDRFDSLNSASGDIGWYDKGQFLTKPNASTGGSVLFSTPYAGSDTNGVNSSAKKSPSSLIFSPSLFTK